MKLSSTLAACTALLGVLSTAGTAFAQGSGFGPLGAFNLRCEGVTIRVNTQSQNLRYVNVRDGDIDAKYASEQILDYSTDMQQWNNEHLPDMTTRDTFNGNFSIAGEYCTPIRGARQGSSLLLATHGVGFGKSYWNFPYLPSYSFARHAASYGYSTLSYDRLGVGETSTPANGGFSIVQAPTEEAILLELINTLRSSNVVGNRQFQNITLVGHSFGSVLSEAIAKDYGNIVSGLALTGFSIDPAAFPLFFLAGAYTPAREVGDLLQLRRKPSQYLATSSRTADVQQFFDPPNYDDAALAVSRSQVQGVTLGELTSVGTILGPAPDFTGPVYVIDGNEDLPFCNRDCREGDKPAQVRALFPASRNFTSEIVDNTGHGITPHPTSGDAYERVMRFIVSNGL